MTVTLQLTKAQFRRLHRHLIRLFQRAEQVAFLFVKPQWSSDALNLVTETIHCCPRNELEDQSRYNIALKDDVKARLIKRAHDMRCALAEAHSHVGKYSAQFSPSDYAGFEEFVPHVRWRLKGQPYTAMVFTKKDMDGFVWFDSGNRPQRLRGIEVNGRVVLPTNGHSALPGQAVGYEKS